ncbi:CRE-MLT-8 protein [Aphelenchoides avenae]|nr:CRE-MLT-8 protein [Aphelenchus avenae]
MKYIPTLFTHLLFLAVCSVFAFEGPDPLSDGDVSLTRLKRQASPLSRAWEEALPGVQPFWEKYNSGPHGIVIRGWQFSRCASEQWTDYTVNVSNIVIWPDYPRFPGPIFFNVTLDVNEELPKEKIEMDLEVRHAVTGKHGSKGWQVIPCQGWNILDGCDGVGSCRYCDMLDKCKETVKGAHKYVNDRKAEDFLRQNKLCPPPKGHWTMTFSKIFTIDDLPKSFFGPLQSNEYWLTFSFTDGKDKKLGCARLWVDVCKYHLQDKQQKCLRDPNAFKNFIAEISSQAEQIRQRG